MAGPAAWRVESEAIENGRVLRYLIRTDDQAMSYSRFASLLRVDADFRRFFNNIFLNAPLDAFFWETPAVTRESFGQDFEFVLVDAPSLVGVAADARAFADQFQRRESEAVAVFSNLAGDATLVAPCPQSGADIYAHLAVFAREAPAGQVDALWQQVGESICQGIGDQPLWVSTSGLGVYWLHIRLDRTPKYYTWQPYLDSSH